MKKSVFIIFIAITVFGLKSCKNTELSYIKSENQRNVINFRVLPFDISDVKLLPGPFYHATELNKSTLKNYNPDRLLAGFREEAGLKPKAKRYGGWESETLAGHSLGHYLSGCALMYKTSGDTVFKNRVDYIAGELDSCQKAEKSGYLGAVPGARKVFDTDMVKGDIRSRGFDLNGIWAPIYTQHKIMAGLLDAYELCGNKTALEVARRFADWMNDYISKMSPAQIQDMLNCEHGGINEALAELYSITGEQKYLTLSHKFYHKAILDSLLNGRDILPGKHANTQIPKLIGLERYYELTGNDSSYKAAKFFWDRVVNHHSYVTGGHCDNEYFGPADSLRNRLSTSTTETCNVYNMLKLSQHLFEWEASAQVADFCERALFNHILPSQHPDSGRVVYNLSLEMGGYKEFQDPEFFTCCIGTAMETHSKYALNIYYHNKDELFVSQYIASQLTWKEKNVVVSQNTSFPEEQGSVIKINTKNPVDLSIFVRYPYWAIQNFEILINGKKWNVNEKPGSFVKINRKWIDNDSIEVKMPFQIRYETMPDDKNRLAFFYGPLVLAGDLGSIKDTDIYNSMFVPVFIADNSKIKEWILPVQDEKNTFKTVNAGRPRDVELKPFYKIYDRRYSVYWDIFTEERWQKYQDEYKRRLDEKKKIEAITIDFFQPGEMQPERDHKFKENRSYIGEHKGRKYREANDWISCEMKSQKVANLGIMVDYWGGFPGAKTFDIFVNDVLIGTESISKVNTTEFYNRIYKVPENLVSNGKITVMFKAKPGNRLGPIFGVRTIKNNQVN